MFSPAVFTVFCGWEIDGVGLMAARNIMELPSLIPPRIPTMVGLLQNLSVFGDERIIVDTSFGRCNRESITDFYTFDSPD